MFTRLSGFYNNLENADISIFTQYNMIKDHNYRNVSNRRNNILTETQNKMQNTLNALSLHKNRKQE